MRIKFRDVAKMNKRGGWEQPIMRGYKIVCCDCGLVHTMDFRVLTDKKGKPHVQFKVERANRLTAQWRKQEGITVKRGSHD